MQQLRRIKLTQRQSIARYHNVSTETVRRWVRFIEENSLDWIRCNPTEKTPRFLHPYQLDLLDWVLAHRDHGSVWIEQALLHDNRLTFNFWKSQQQTA